MPNNTPIAALPYPILSERPDGPNQIGALARAIDPLLVNRFTTAADRSNKLTKPAAGALSYRIDGGIYEYYDGKEWRGLNTTQCVDEYLAVSFTALAFTTTESKALGTTARTLTNPSKIYRMFYMAFAEFNLKFTSTKDAQQLGVRHYIQIGTGIGGARLYNFFTYGSSGNFTGVYPLRTGYIAASGNIAIKSWITIEKLGGAAGTINLGGGGVSLSLVGVTSV